MKEETDDEIREKLKHAVLVAFDRWGAQNFDQIVRMGRWQDTPEGAQEKYLEDLFMSKRVFILGFFRHVTREVMENADSQRQLRAVTKAGLITIIKEEGVSVRELETKGKDDGQYTRKSVQNIFHDRYANTFFESRVKPKGEGNVVPKSSVFSLDSDPPLDNPIRVKKLQLADRIATATNARAQDWIRFNAAVEVVFPEKIRFLVVFRKLCRELLQEIGDRSRRCKVLVEELAKPEEIFQIFANHMLSIISIGWFNGRQEKSKRALIHDGFPFRYTAEDAKEARLLLGELLESDELAAENFMSAGLAFARDGVNDIAEILHRECLGLRDLDPWYQGVLHENLAVIHRNNSNFKLMVTEMKQAVRFYRQQPDRYRLAVALKNLGEAEWGLGFEVVGLRFFDEAEKVGGSLDARNFAGVLINLASAARRLGQPRLEKKYLAKCLTVCPEDETDKILGIDRRLPELS